MTSFPWSPPTHARRSAAGSRRVRALAMLIGLLAVLGGVAAPAAHAATGQINIVANDPPPPPKPTGTGSSYTINFTCSDLNEDTCGDDIEIRIPLDLTSSNPETPAITSWNYTTSSAIGGLILNQQIVGGELVLTLDPTKVDPGDSQTIQLNVTPPNNVTPDGTTWQLEPTLEIDDDDVATAPTPAQGAASAEARISVSKVTHDGSSFVVKGRNVIYNVTARCNANGSSGNLYLKNGSLVDVLPAGLTFVSADPAPTSVAGQTLTWDYPNAASLPSGCAQGASGSRTYQIVASIDAGVTDLTELTNNVTFSGTPVGESTPATTSAPREITVLDEPPVGPGPGFVTKGSAGPLNIAGAGYIGTYPGNWIPSGNTPATNNPSSAAGRYSIKVRYPASNGFRSDIVDPMPCLDDQSGVSYPSSPVTGPSNAAGQPAIDDLCANPAFHPTVVRVETPSLASAVADGWRPTGIRTNGSSFSLELVGSGNGSATYFTVPTADVGDVAAIRLEPDAKLVDAWLDLDIFGYADPSTEGGEVLDDTVSVTAYPTNGANPTTGTDDARIAIEENAPQLGVHKSFGGYRSGAGGTTPLNLTGRVSTPAPVSGDIVLADLLPFDMSWSNAPASGSTVTYQLTDHAGGSSTPITGTVEHIPNYDATGRELIRVTFPKSAFTGGAYTLSPPSNFILVSVPTGAMTYNNDGYTFMKGSGRATSPVCGQGTTSTPATFESEDPLDLDGDGEAAQNHCSWRASLTVPPPSGPAFGLVKTVQGNLDSAPKYSPGIGEASENGTGEYTLTWRNTGGRDLTDPVIYDILPYVGDTGIGVGQVGNPRLSAFQPEFEGLTAPLPAGVAVEYSLSANPCRDEVLPDSSNPGCVDDWTSTAPGDLKTVRALRFVATGTYQTGDSFTLKFGVRVPVGYVNVVAWNSAASDAKFNGNWMLPAEPPKVGIRAPAPLVTPTLSTEVSKAKVVSGTAVSDTITLDGTKGASGDLDWKLVGPKPAVNGSCAAVDWSGAATVDSGTIAFQGDDDYETPTTALTAFGCYSYVVKATSDFFAAPGEVSHPAGATNEVVQVAPVSPELSTEVSQATIGAADTVFDTITLTDNDDASGTLSWKLVGPKPIGSDGTCTAVDWSGADEVDSGTLPFNGNGDYDTPPTALSGAGCYSYVVEATSAQYDAPVGHPAGAPNEVVRVRPATIVTAASKVRIAPGAEITDRVELTGTGGGAGTLEWKIVGPIRANEQGTCENLDWTDAQTFDSGTIAVGGDGVYHTDPSTPTETGCYSYVQLLNGSSAGGPSLHAAGEPNEMFYVGRPTVSTTVSSAAIPTRGSLLDTINVKGTGGGAGELRWKLYGPVLPGIGETCLGLDWRGSTVVGQGTIPVTGDGTYLTPPSLPLLIAGCYGYEVILVGEDYGDPVVSPAGTPGEVSLVKPPVVPQQTARVSIEKSASHKSVSAGKQIRYTLTATNSGLGTAQNVVIADTPKSGMRFVSASAQQGVCSTGFPLTCNVGAIPPGGKVSVTVVAVPTESGRVVNGAMVTTDTPNESPANEVVADSRVTVKVPVRITKRASSKTVRAGKRVTFTVKITNRSKVASGRARVCDRMPSGMVLVSVRGKKVTRKGGEHCWTVPALKPGQSRSYRVTARVLGGAKGKQTNRVTIKGDSVQTKSARATVKVRAVPVRAGGVTG